VLGPDRQRGERRALIEKGGGGGGGGGGGSGPGVEGSSAAKMSSLWRHAIAVQKWRKRMSAAPNIDNQAP